MRRSPLGLPRALAIVALGSCAALGAHACTDEEELLRALGEGCLLDSDCNSPLVCAFRRCHTQCADNRDCAAGENCVLSEPKPLRVCLLPDESKCTYSSECPGELVCGIDGHCRNECGADRDCVPEQKCVSGTCAAPNELVDGGLIAISEGPSGHPCSFTTDCQAPEICIDGVCRVQCQSDDDCNPYTCDPETKRCISELECTPGAQVACACPGPADAGIQGVQICADDGFSLGECMGCPDAG